MTAAAVHTVSDAPLFLFAGRGFLTCDLEELRGALSELKRWEDLPPSFPIADWEAALSVSPLQMQQESVRLLYHPNGAPCPPWQSVQTEEAVLMGRTHHDALEWYREAGMEPALSNEPADHAGLLLAFYGRLLMDEVEEERLEAFRAAHLSWLVKYASLLRSETRLEYYRLLGALISTLVAA